MISANDKRAVLGRRAAYRTKGGRMPGAFRLWLFLCILCRVWEMGIGKLSKVNEASRVLKGKKK